MDIAAVPSRGMATADVGRSVKEHPRATVAVLSVLGYGLVVGTFLGLVPRAVFPDLTLAQVNLLSHAIAAVNTVATVLLVLGWRWIRRGEVRKHAAAMAGSFGLILVFLVMYLTKIGGGGTKEMVGAPQLVYYAYLAMLAVHVVLSIVAVPVVLYALVLGVTHTPRELRAETAHRRVGRVAAASWILSLSLGVVTYLMLNHVYEWRFVEAFVTVPRLLVGA
jgi:putative membrane protein